MNIFITGASGLVGSHLVNTLEKKSEASLLTPTIDELDITNDTSLTQYFEDASPNIVIHFAAFTDVGRAEEQRGDTNGDAWKINVEGTRNIAQAAKKTHAYMIYISTDMVFSGRQDDPGPYDEDHNIEQDESRTPWYGWTKGQGERVVHESAGAFAILRISNPARAHYDQKLDHVRKILNLFDQNKLYPLFDDQYLTLSFVDEVTMTIKKLISTQKRGIFHASSCDVYTPFDLAQYLLKKARGVEGVVDRTSIHNFFKNEESAKRYIQFGGLDVKKTQRKLTIRFSPWKKIVDMLVHQIETGAMD